ncbi:MAG: 3-oxoacyl-[acyl-carrier-protein] reductase [Elusimicrobia bacterium]|nr:3-oxoacyl-[acyl-carrier-protein] reductase [Elusimicrobiota bacterium]
MEFKDKVVVITGGTRGIGKALVETFAFNGAKVIFTYAQNDEMAAKLKNEIESKGGYADPYKLDVKNYEEIEKWRDKIIEKYEKIDVLINNAGIIKDKALMMMTKEDWLDVIDTNLNGLYNITRNFIVTFMKQKEGCIVNISSVSGVIGLPRQTNYSASKGGIIAFTKALAKEVASLNIRVNAIAPGFISTDMTATLKDDLVKKMLSLIPLQRFGKPEDVAKAALFLASKDSSYITGHTLVIDGGLSMRD